MSEEAKNNQCQICHSYLFDDDDVVICPTCGAPHHRDCWQTVGHCGVEHNHGTDLQYDKVKKSEAETSSAHDTHFAGRSCKFCGRVSKTEGADFCPYCGQPYKGQGVNGQPPFIINGSTINLDPLGGVPKDTKIEGVTASDVATFVGNNSARYVHKFKDLNKGNKNSWNWLAFLFPSAWCLSRKMYGNGILFLMVSLAANLCYVPFSQTMSSLGDVTKMTREQLVSLATDNIGAFSTLSWIMCAVGLVLFILPHIICGIRGDWMYRGFAINKIKTILDNPDIENKEDELRHKGSVSLLMISIALIIEQYLPSILATLLW